MTQPKPLPPVALLRELFEYEPETGELTNKVRRSSRLPGSSAGTTRPDGYKLLGIDGKMYLLHRVVWAIHHNHEPEGMLDHIDGNPGNNKIENLRLSNHSLNGANARKREVTTTGAYKQKNKWCARGTVDGVHVYLGMHSSQEEAHQAYVRWHLSYFGEHSIYARDELSS